MKVPSLEQANQLVNEHGYRVIEHISHSRGDRLNCISRSGRVFTLSINHRHRRPKEGDA